MRSVAEAPETGPANNAPMAGVEPAQAIALDELIDADQATHGDFADSAAIGQALKTVLAVAPARLGAVQREAWIRSQSRSLRRRSDLCRALARRAGYAWLAGRHLAGTDGMQDGTPVLQASGLSNLIAGDTFRRTTNNGVNEREGS
jgi:hypothetical protein